MSVDLLVGTLAAVGGATLAPLLDRAVERMPRHDPAVTPIQDDGPQPGCAVDCRTAVPHRRALLSAMASLSFFILGIASRDLWDLSIALALVACLLPLAFCDYEHLLLPKRLVWSCAGLVVVAILAAVAGGGTPGGFHRAVVAAACGIGAWLGLGLLWLLNPRGLGFGDVRLALPIGLALGWFGVGALLLGLLLASLGASLTGCVMLVARRTCWGRSTALPFGIYLTAGSLVALVVAPLVT